MRATVPAPVRAAVIAYRPRVRHWRILRAPWWGDRVQSICEMATYDLLKLAGLGALLELLIHCGRGA